MKNLILCTCLFLSFSMVRSQSMVTFYTSMGGLRAVLWTDTFQTFVVVGGLLGVVIIGTGRTRACVPPT